MSEPITQADLEAAVAAATAPLRAEIESLRKPPPAEPPPAKYYTRAELQKAVDDEQITPAQMENIWQEQTERRTKEQVDQAVTNAVNGATREQRVRAQIQEYVDLIPELATKGSDPHKRVERQYKNYVDNGSPEILATELAALQTLFGPIEAVRSSRRSTEEIETHAETGGGAAPTGAAPKKLKLSADRERHYQYLIDRGIYSGWDAVEAEMKYAKPKYRAA